MHLKYAEFYITNVCDLSCTNCNKFNNFNFKGVQKWKDLEHLYDKWASILDLDRIAIVGGEPLTNPDLVNWVKGVRKLWPNAKISVATNGNRLSKSLDVIKIMKENNVSLRITIHSQDLHNQITNDLQHILVAPVTRNIEYLPYNIEAWQHTYNAIKAEHWPKCDMPDDFLSLPIDIQKECREVFNFSKETFDSYEALNELIDANGFIVELWWGVNFHESALIFDNGKFKLRSSDPVKAVTVCDQKTCHAFKDGKLHKCGVAHALPEAVAQFKIQVDPNDQQILNNYQPAEADWDNDKMELFMHNLKNVEPIDMCKFCPETYSPSSIGNVAKKKY